MAEVQQADPGTRRFAVACVVVAAALGAGALSLLDTYRQSLLSWFLANAPHVRVSIIVVALLLLLAPLLLMAAWVWKYGVRVVRDGRHPPNGVKVIRDTPVSYGAVAQLYGRFYQALAALFVLAALSLLWFSWMIWRLR